MKPSEILEDLCIEGKVDGPDFKNGIVTVADKTYALNEDTVCNSDVTDGQENGKAYYALTY